MNDNLSINKYSDNLEELEKELELIISNKPIIDIQLSKEQQNIIQCKNNIIVDAVAGSGKTTTILHLALEYPDKNILQITYNNMLKREVRTKVNRLAINNMLVHTYHSLAVKYYKDNAYTDEQLKKIINLNLPLRENLNQVPIDILLIDETQDMSMDYYNLIKKFISDTNSNPKIVIIGDKYQGIYNFKGANIKFLTLADKIWDCQFDIFKLSISYRLTHEISWFVNKVMLNNNRINTIKSGPAVDYYIANSYTIYKKIGKYIRLMIETQGIKEQDIFILTPSVKSLDPPYKKLENYLVKFGFKCTTPSSDESKLDDKIIANKIVFTTYHQAKGRERKIVILYNFDDSFTQFFGKNNNNQDDNQDDNDNNDDKSCPNILYVGATRASLKLILIQDNRYKPLNFLNLSLLKTSPKLNLFIIDKQNIYDNLSKLKKIKKISVTDLIKFITSQTIDLIIGLIDNTNNLFSCTREPSNIINIPNKILIKNIINGKEIITWEDVSDLNGLVIPAIYEKKLLNTISTIENYVHEQLNNSSLKILQNKYIGKINIPANSLNDYLKIGNVYLTLQNKLHAKIAQIKKYNWLNYHMIELSHNNMNILTNNIIFEIPIKSFNPIIINSDNYNLDNLDNLNNLDNLDNLDNLNNLDGLDNLDNLNDLDDLNNLDNLDNPTIIKSDVIADNVLIYEHNEFGQILITGRLDAIDNDCVWEFKCTDHITLEHRLQIIVYAWAWNLSQMDIKYGHKDFYLLNIKSGQILKLLYNKIIIDQIVELIFQDKYANKKYIDDAEFINLCNRK